jgi:flagellin-like protein
MDKERGQNEAVSPVIGVILMVAITVILAAIIGTFVLGLGSQTEQNARAGVNADVDNRNGDVEISVTTMGNADYVVIRGASPFDSIRGSLSRSGVGVYDNVYLNETGQSIKFDAPTGSPISGRITIVAVIGDVPSNVNPIPNSESDYPDESDTTQTTIRNIEYEDLQSPT